MAQTKKDIQALLNAAGINPLKRYGQHFLIDGNLLRKLVATAGVTRSDAVLEVGPGTGTLTEELLAHAGHVVAVEIDKGLAAICRERFGKSPRFTLLLRDVLERKSRIASEVLETLEQRRAALAAGTDAEPRGHGDTETRSQADKGTEERVQGSGAGGQVGGKERDRDREAGCEDGRDGRSSRALLVANLPYQIATPLLIELLMGERSISPLCFTVQREVADRLAAPPGGKDYGPISVFAQALATLQRIARVPPEAFWPAPQVDSAMLRMDLRTDQTLPPPVKRELARLVHGCFNHRRKTMRYSLRELLSDEQYQRVEAAGQWPLSDRPERISVEQWVELARFTAGA